MSYDKGDVVRVEGKFFDPDNPDRLVDPSGVVFKYKTPAGVTTTLTYGVDGGLVKQSIGVYYVDLNLAASGEWYTRWEASGSYQGAQEGRLIASASNF